MASQPSFTSDLAFSERRQAERQVTIFAVGKLTFAGTEHICVFRDISGRGARIEIATPIPVGSWVEVEMRSLPSTRATVRWAKDRFIGLQFSVIHDLQALFDAQHDAKVQPRGPRFSLEMTAELRTDHRRLPIEIADIAFGGMKLRGTGELPAGTKAEIMLPGHDQPMTGHVRWSHDGELGFRLIEPLSRATLSAILLMAGHRKF